MKPVIGISMGDPAGIGPEIIVKALACGELDDKCDCLVVGDARVIKRAVEILDLDMEVRSIGKNQKIEFSRGDICVYDLGNADPSLFELGKVSAYSGRAAYDAVESVIELALNKTIDATVTAPINKEAINLAGCKFSGHTEIYASLTGTKDYAMMLAHNELRVIHVSTHVALREACNRVRKDRVKRVIDIADESLKKLGIKSPGIAVAGLNPHAGENGLFGDEEIREIIPAIEAAKREGIEVSGPFPPDTIFPMAAGGLFDIVVVMYHDQGHIPLKFAGFKYDKEKGKWNDVAGINVTLGLPIIRTSVDHGTAFDQAGKGTASPTSMLNAVEYAVKLGGN